MYFVIRGFLCFHTEVSFHSIPLTCLQAKNSLKSLTFIAFPQRSVWSRFVCADGEFVFGVGKDHLKHGKLLVEKTFVVFLCSLEEMHHNKLFTCLKFCAVQFKFGDCKCQSPPQTVSGVDVNVNILY